MLLQVRRKLLKLQIMRVITGYAKGCKLSTPDGLDVRPTLDRVKEALFSMLYPYLNDSLVLDLFAGSGGLGIEALSRGASKCVFVDKNKRAYDCVINNLRYTKLIDKSQLYLCDFNEFFTKNTQKFDIVFLDPPYSVGIEDNVFPMLLSHLSDDAVVVFESEKPLKQFEGYEVLKNAKYGRVYVAIYKPMLGGGNQ